MRKPSRFNGYIDKETGRLANVFVDPITYNSVDDVYIFYTPHGRLVQSKTYEEAEAKFLLTKETD